MSAAAAAADSEEPSQRRLAGRMLAGRMLAERMLLERVERMRVGRTLVAAALTTGMACSSQCSAQAQQASQLLAKQHVNPLVDGRLVSPCLQSQEAQEQTQCKPQVDPRSLDPPLAMDGTVERQLHYP